jgi:hypothetical protein
MINRFSRALWFVDEGARVIQNPALPEREAMAFG